MAQAVSHRPVTVESRVRARVSPRGICGGQNFTGTGFLRFLWPCQYNSIMALHIHIVMSSQVLFTMEVYYTESSIHNS
jgi:hypothetical protein